MSVLLGSAGFGLVQMVHRARIWRNAPSAFLGSTVVYAVLLLLLLVMAQTADASSYDDNLAWCAFVGLFLSDSIVVGRVNAWAKEERIDREAGLRLQFSLMALCTQIVLWGLYLALLAWLFPNKLQ